MTEILIKKYENRRLYCVPEAKYVSLNEIKDFLQRGDTVKVIEKASGKDITKYVMMQVLLEDRYELLPTYFYQMVLQSPKEALEPFFKQFFPWMLDMYMKSKDGSMAPGPMPFQNPWFQNPFMNVGNPFMQNMASNSKNKSTKESDSMSEILDRLKDLESKINKE